VVGGIVVAHPLSPVIAGPVTGTVRGDADAAVIIAGALGRVSYPTFT
jgi:mannose/fructose/N-acetylgalactosamine-specific phosphotransferase system component IIC